MLMGNACAKATSAEVIEISGRNGEVSSRSDTCCPHPGSVATLAWRRTSTFGLEQSRCGATRRWLPRNTANAIEPKQAKFRAKPEIPIWRLGYRVNVAQGESLPNGPRSARVLADIERRIQCQNEAPSRKSVLIVISASAAFIVSSPSCGYEHSRTQEPKKSSVVDERPTCPAVTLHTGYARRA